VLVLFGRVEIDGGGGGGGGGVFGLPAVVVQTIISHIHTQTTSYYMCV